VQSAILKAMLLHLAEPWSDVGKPSKHHSDSFCPPEIKPSAKRRPNNRPNDRPNHLGRTSQCHSSWGQQQHV